MSIIIIYFSISIDPINIIIFKKIKFTDCVDLKCNKIGVYLIKIPFCRHFETLEVVVEEREEKVQTLMMMNTGREDFEIEFDGDDLTMTLPEEMAYDQNWSFTKFSLVTTLREHVGVGKVIFREVHEPRQIEEEE